MHSITPFHFPYMKGSVITETDEPIGIVISSGSRADPPPSVFAYIWAPAPGEIDDVLESKVA